MGRRCMRANTLVRLGFLSAVLCGIVFAQADRGTIRGTVTDAAGAVVPGTPVAAVNVATGVRSATATSGAGNYNLPALAPGLYRVETEGPGFKRLVRENIQVNAGVVVSLDLQLEIGATNETVTVTAEAPPLEKDSSDL